MKIVCNHFGDPDFSRLAGALRASVEANAPDVEFCELVTAPPDNKSKLTRHYTDNHAKLKVWRAAVHAEPDDAEIVLMDADTIVLGDMQEAFDDGNYYDIGWTWRPGRLPMNGGVVFVRCTARARAFMDAWVARDEVLMRHRTLADHGAKKYGGANQASFMWLVTHGAIGPLPPWLAEQISTTNPPLLPDTCDGGVLLCRKWNSVDQTWCQFNADTRVVHIKGKLRDACLGKDRGQFFEALKTLAVNGVESDVTIGRLAEIWRKYDPERKAVAA